MRPNTPHYVLTTDAAICHGGHFYAMSTMRDTIFGIFHMFALSKTITNTEHTRDSHLLLRRLTVYLHHVLVKGQFDPKSPALPAPHVPDVSTFEGALDLFLVCVVAELGELLDPASYKKRHRDDLELEHDRLSIIHVRGLARELRAWWSSQFMFVYEDDPAVDGEAIFLQVFRHQVKALISYKRDAEKANMEAEEPACHATAFEVWTLRYFPRLWGEAIPKGASLDNFEWKGTGYTVIPARVNKLFEPGSSKSDVFYLSQ
jgi:hypothetical protein